jgi:hypothetical protein
MLSLLFLCLVHSPFYFRTDVTHFPHLEVLNALLTFTITQNNGKFVPTLNVLVPSHRGIRNVATTERILNFSTMCR